MKHELVQFENGSYSLRSPESGEAMHSKIGAWEEAQRIYVYGTGLPGRLRSAAPLTIYDVGLGIAANALAAMACHRELNSECEMSIVSFESDLDGLRLACAETMTGKFPFLRDHLAVLDQLLLQREVRVGKIHWRVLEGDFLNVIATQAWRELPMADIVFYDFYSPDTHPALWEESVFMKLRDKLNPHALLATYACRKSVIKNLLLAKLYVGEGAGTGAKKTTTLALRDWPMQREVPSFTLLNESWFARLAASSHPVSEMEWARLRALNQFHI